MVAIAFFAMVIFALVSIVVHWTMRIRLMRLDSTKDRIEWLSFRGGDDVLNTYEALFPQSVLPIKDERSSEGHRIAPRLVSLRAIHPDN